MRATAVLIKNVLGIEELRIKPGQVTTVSGRNATGKTSVLMAFQAALRGGNLANLRRIGAVEDPEVVLVLDDGAYRIERKGDDTVVRQRVGDSAAYEKIRRPQEFLDSLVDGVMCNPIRLLRAKPAEFRDILLEVLPLQLDRGALLAAIGDVWPAGRVLPDAHPLTVIEYARTTLFDERTGVNRSQKDKAAAAHELEKQIPAQLPDDPASDLLAAGEARDMLFRRLTEQRAAAEAAHDRAVAGARAANEAEESRIDGEFKVAAARLRQATAEKVGALQRQMLLLNAEAETAIQVERTKGEAAQKAADQAFERAEAEAAAARTKALDSVAAAQPDLRASERRVAELAALAKDVIAVRERKAMADKFLSEADGLEQLADRLTKALDAVGVYEAQLLADTPIPGLEFRGKDVSLGGVPLEHVNTAAAIRLAVQIAVLRTRTKALPLIWVDGAEALDLEQLEILEKEILASGAQAVVARVDEGPLHIETRGA